MGGVVSVTPTGPLPRRVVLPAHPACLVMTRSWKPRMAVSLTSCPPGLGFCPMPPRDAVQSSRPGGGCRRKGPGRRGVFKSKKLLRSSGPFMF